MTPRQPSAPGAPTPGTPSTGAPDDEEGPLDARALATLAARRARLRAAGEVDGAGERGAGDEAVVWAAELSVDGEAHALPLERLRAAVPLRAVTAVPLAPAHVIGVLRFDGRIVPAFSLLVLLGAARGWRDDPATLLVLDDGAGRVAAVDCEETPRPVAVHAARVAQAARARRDGALVTDVVTEDLRPLRWIHVPGLFARALELARGA